MRSLIEKPNVSLKNQEKQKNKKVPENAEQQETFENDQNQDDIDESKHLHITSRQLKFNAFFLGFFQTSHLWGNILSSVLLAGFSIPMDRYTKRLNTLKLGSDLATCGIYDIADSELSLNFSLQGF